MSKGDNLFGIKTIYKGIEFKSILETRIAFFLDELKIKWEYEPKVFTLSDGTFYIPDFYLPQLKMWIEGKGLIEDNNINISKIFAEDNQTELLLISSEKRIWFSTKDFEEGSCQDEDIFIGKCQDCKSYYFCSSLGSYHCRKCGNHNGDHDLIVSFNAFFFNEKPIDFSSIENIKSFLETIKRGRI